MIGTRQYEVVYNKFFLQLLKEGKIPTFEEVLQAAGSKLPDATDVNEPIYQYIGQQRKGVFDVEMYNGSQDDIRMDLELLFEELDDITQKNIQRVLHSNMFHAVHHSELTRLSHVLDALLFSTDGADENFFVQFEDFSDLSKIDSENSTNGILNTAEGALALPIGLNGALKIDMSHMNSKSSPDDWAISRGVVLAEKQIPHYAFGNIVKDTVFPWAHTITMDSNGPLEVTFTLRLKHEEFINRITVVPFSYKKTTAIFKTSVDKVNIKDIQDYSDGIPLITQAITYSLDFEDRLVDYIHIILHKDEADTVVEGDDGVKQFIYNFGIRNISMYSTGRFEKATYQSLPFDFSEDITAIGRVALNTTDAVPENTSIDWYVVPVDDDSKYGNPIAITPQNYSMSTGPPKSVILQDVLANTRGFETNNANIANVDSNNNVDYWRIQLLLSEPVFGTAKLYRGFKSWFRDSSIAVNPVLVKDNYITFSKGDTQTLYNLAIESNDYVVSDLNGEDVPVVVLSKRPLYNPAKGHFLTPDSDINPNKDTQPNYAVYRASLTDESKESTKAFSFEDGAASSPGNPRTKDLERDLIKYASPGDVRISRISGSSGGNSWGSKEYVDGIDYIMQLDENGFANGKITGLHDDMVAENPLSTADPKTWYSFRIYYDVDPELTRHILAINGHQVYFNIRTESIGNWSITIRYRHAAEEILKASVKAKSAYGILATEIFVQGIDYIFDSVNGTIQRLTTGGINSGADIYVDYKFNDLADQLEQFFTWVHVEDPAGKSIATATKDTGFMSKESILEPDSEIGEQLLANIPGVGLIDLTKSTEWPAMFGWTQFVVKSTNPTQENNALVNQVIKLKDNSGSFIFVHNGKYFDILTAIRNPLTQVSYPFLKNGVFKNDHSKFSVRKVLGGTISYEVIINFQPNTDENLYRYVPNASAGSDVVEIVEVDESWEVKWSSTESNNDSVSKIAVRAVLNRNKKVDGNITPKVSDYFIKVGF